MRRSDAHHAVELLRHPCNLRRCDPTRLQPLQVFVGRPTGDRAALSDVDGNFVVAKLLEQLAHRRNADTFDPFGGLARHKLRGVAREDDGALLLYLDRAVGGDVEGIDAFVASPAPVVAWPATVSH